MPLKDSVDGVIEGIQQAVSDVRKHMREINEIDIRNDLNALLKASEITLRRFENGDLSTFVDDLLNLRSIWLNLSFHEDIEAREGTDRIRILRGLAGNVALGCALGAEKILTYRFTGSSDDDASKIQFSKTDAPDLLMSLSGRLSRLETVLSDYSVILGELSSRTVAEAAITDPYLLQMQGDVSTMQAALQVGSEVDVLLLDRIVSGMAGATIAFINTLKTASSRASSQLLTAASKIARNVNLVTSSARHLARHLFDNAMSSLETWSTRVWNSSPDTREMKAAHYELRWFGFRLSMMEFAVLWHFSRGHEIPDIARVLAVDRETVETALEGARLRMNEPDVEGAAERLARYWEMWQRYRQKELSWEDLKEFHRSENSGEG